MRRETARRVCFILLLGLCGNVFAAPPVYPSIIRAAQQPLRILPLGDSITQSDAQHLGYRYVLWKMLIDAGKQFDFVGSMNPAQGERPPGWSDYQGQAFDADHEGHSGWTAGDLLDGCSWEPEKGKLSDWLKSYTPDIVLLHIGTNDAFHMVPTDLTVEKIGAIIDLLRPANPNVTVFLAKIIPLAGEWARDYNANIVTLNGRMDGIAAAKTTATSKVVVIDQYSGFDGENDTYDSIHPSDSGAVKMAQRWADAILFDGTPITRNDHYSAVQERPLRVDAAAGALANDYASGAPLEAALAGPTANGVLTLRSSGEFEYVPNTGFTGTDSFTYRAECNGKTSPACTVSIDVVSNAPVANDDRFGTAQDTALKADAASGVLSNDVSYIGALNAALAEGPRNGRLVFNADGSFEYTPAPRYIGADEFQYTATDGRKSSGAATVRIWNGHIGPVACWKLGEQKGLVASNSVDTKHDGALVNMDETHWVPDAAGRALEFDGKDDYVAIPPLNLNANILTLTAWVKRDGVQPIFAGIVFCADGDTLAGLGLGSASSWEPNHELAYFWNGSFWNWHSGLILPDNEWCLVALAVTPTHATVYLSHNGVLTSAANNRQHDPEEFNGVTRIGNNAQKESRFFKGLIRDVRIYDRQLSADEIRQLAGGAHEGERP